MTQIGNIDHIDWFNDDGVNLAMINDFTRNLFYDRIIKNNVQNRDVLDIGFGTGLLSMIALQHGARSVTAYESDPNRYVLGTQIIEKLGLNDKITLINQRFDHSHYANFKDYVVVTETVNGNIWQEGIFNSLPRAPGQAFLPGQYFLNIYALDIPRAFAQGLGVERTPCEQFTPALDLNSEFIDIVNSYFVKDPVAQTNQPLPTIKSIDPHVDTNWGWTPFLRCTNENHCVASYIVDAETLVVAKQNQPNEMFDFDATHLHLTLDIDTSESMLILPRVGMQHGSEILFLDRGHWGPTPAAIVVSNFTGQLKVLHNLHNGDISYELNPVKN